MSVRAVRFFQVPKLRYKRSIVMAAVPLMLLVCMLSACDTSGEESDQVRMRIQNQSGLEFDSVGVVLRTETPNERVQVGFSELSDGGVSSYETLPPSSTGGHEGYDYVIAFGSQPNSSFRFGPLTPDGFQPGSYTLRLKYDRFSCQYLGLETAVQESSGGDAVEVRMRNQSDLDFDHIVGGFPTEDRPAGVGRLVEFGSLDAGGSVSEYREVERAYRYAYAEAVVGSDTLVNEPIDYVGEELLPPGKYTYDLQAGERTCFEDQTDLTRSE